MLLETLDTKQNDVVIYSQNIFNLENNFKIIYKDAALKKPHSISYYEVCNFVNNASPKVIIVYRMLTNLTNFTLQRSQYGFPMFIDNNPDLVFFDPVYAIKELESLSGVIDMQNLRFRIQQVGLNSIIRRGDRANFTEIYCFDLSSKEAVTQNDKIFADAIFALDENFVDDEHADLKKYSANGELKENSLNIDKGYSPKDFQRFIPETPPVMVVQTQETFTQTTSKRKTAFGDFIEQNKQKQTQNYPESASAPPPKSMIQIFKSTGQLKDYVHGRNEEPVILKFNK